MSNYPHPIIAREGWLYTALAMIASPTNAALHRLFMNRLPVSFRSTVTRRFGGSPSRRRKHHARRQSQADL